MYSKKINELATNLNPQSSDLVPIGDAVTGQLKTTTFGNIFGTSADGIISGGVVTWSGTGLLFNVSSCQYSLNGIRYTTAATTITLTAANPTNARIDVIAVNTSSQVVLITGTPSANPVEPQVDPATQIQLTNITVNAGGTTPNITNELIYDENVETWTKTNSGFSSVNYANTISPYVGTKSISAIGVASVQGISNTFNQLFFTSPSTLDINNYSVFKIAIKLSRALNNTDVLELYLKNDLGYISRIALHYFGNVPNVQSDYGFDYTSTSWQLISISLPSISKTGNQFKIFEINLQFFVSPFTLNVDRIELQTINNSLPVTQSKSFGIVQTSSGAATAQVPTDTLTLTSSGLTTLSATGKTLTIATPSPIPSQTGNANKALTTNGTTLSWGVVPVNKAGDTMTGNLILNANPSSALGAATKDYVDTLINGIDWKQSANAGTVAALPTYSVSGSGQILTGTANGAIPSATTDGYTLLAGNRVLVKNEINALTPNNGIYVVTQVGSGSLPFILTRSSDANTSALLAEATISINNGTTLSNTQWHSNPASLPITIGTTNITFNQIGSGVYAAGSGLSLTGNIFSIATNGVTDAMIQSATNWNTAYTNRITSATSPLSITSNTISIQQASASQNGYLSSSDWSTFNSKQNALTLTTTGTSGAATLVGSTLNIPQYGGGAAIGGTVTGGTAGSVLFINPTSTLAQDNTNFYWDDTNNRLGIGTNTPGYSLDVSGVGRFTGNMLCNRGQVEGNGTENGYVSFKQTTTGTNLWEGTLQRTSVGPMYDYGLAIIVNTLGGGNYKGIILDASLITATNTRNFKFPDQDGTLALTSNVQTPITLTTTGTSGAATFTSGTLNIPQYQAALTNPVTGTGTTNELTYWTSSSAVGSLSTATYPSLTELSYVKGVTSAIQTQLNGKQGTLTLTTTGTSGAATLVGNTLNIPQYSGGASIGGAVTSGTTGSILFINPTATLAQDNANLFWDDTNNRLGVGINVPLYRLDVNGTGRYQDNLLVSKNQNGQTNFVISNTTNAANSAAQFVCTSDTSSGELYISKLSSTTTGYKIIASKDARIVNFTGGDIAILNDFASGTIKFAAGGSSTAQAVIKTTGQLQLNNYTSTSSFTGTAAGYLAFDSSGNILSAAVPSSSTVTFNRQTSSYTLVLGDAGKMIEMNVGTANNLTVPLNSSVAFPTGTQIDVTQYGAGQTTFVATAGVTIRSNNGWLKMNAQYGAATLVKVGTDEWYLFGNINA